MRTSILLIEDNELQAELVVGPLSERGYEVTWAQDGTSGLRLAHEVAPNCILLDVQLPDIDGFTVCRLLAARAATREIPVIMLTTRSSVPDRIKGLETGATDYLAKPFDLGELEARIVSCLRTQELQREVREKNKQLEDLLAKFRVLASTDELTGLFNRRRFFEEIDREMHRFVRYGSPLSLLIVDVDRFKSINDTYGHQAGDEVLRAIGRLLSASSRRTDTVARYGGEEFAALLPETAIEEAMEVAERLREAIEVGCCASLDPPVGVTVSIGAACGSGEVSTPQALIRAADTALYRAKVNGRNRVESALPPED